MGQTQLDSTYEGAGLRVQMTALPRDHRLILQAREYERLTVVPAGTLQVVEDETLHEITGPDSFVMRAGVYYTLQAMTDAVLFSVSREAVS